MRLHQATSLSEVASIIDARFIGPADLKVTGINEVHVVESGDIAFVDHPKYYDATLDSKATVVIIDKEVACPQGKGLIIHEAPFDAFNQLTSHFKKLNEEASEASPQIHPDATVMPGAHVGKYVSIGQGSILHPGAVIYDHCIIGDNVTIHANAVIGSDAFYFKRKPGKHEKLRSVGRVILENNVEIGAACTIDRGVTGDTVIGEGTKMDNHVHVGHDTKIGKRCLFAAQVGIAGCVTIQDGVTMWGQAGCAANITIGEGAVILAQAGVGKSLAGGQSYFGSPAGEARRKMREVAILSGLANKK